MDDRRLTPFHSVGAHILAQGSVDGDVVPHGLDQFPGDGAQGLVAKHLYRAVIGLQRVVEGEFVFR